MGVAATTATATALKAGEVSGTDIFDQQRGWSDGLESTMAASGGWIGLGRIVDRVRGVAVEFEACGGGKLDIIRAAIE